ncbi:MAG: sugar phosphate isomerase/epimerase [Planctomycetota bacterium]|nr:sugar phosphate isomerase/epimerase [Planctomycetota bacterium]
MRFGFSTNLLVDRNLHDALETIARHGFSHVEILADEPHAQLCTARPAEYGNITGLLDRLSLVACNVNANTVRCMRGSSTDFQAFEPSLSALNPAKRAKRITYTRRAIKLAAIIGAECCSITSGPMPEKDAGVRLSLLNESLGELIDYADELKVKLAIEYEPGLLIGSFRQAWNLLKCHEMLWLNFDIGHAIVCGEDPVAIVHKAAGRIGHVHFEDIEDREHVHLPPGEGDAPLDEIVDALAQEGYKGTITFELYSCADRPEEALAAAARYAQSRSFR